MGVNDGLIDTGGAYPPYHEHCVWVRNPCRRAAMLKVCQPTANNMRLEKRMGAVLNHPIYGTASYGCYTPKLRAMPTELTSGVYAHTTAIHKDLKLRLAELYYNLSDNI